MSRLRVLIADDEELARLRMRSLLADCVNPSAEVVAEAASGTEALHQLSTVSADVVLLDIRMPGLDGLQLAERLRKLPDAPRVVFVTAHAEHALQAFDIDAVDYLTKPVRRARLQEALARVAQRRGDGAATASGPGGGGASAAALAAFGQAGNGGGSGSSVDAGAGAKAGVGVGANAATGANAGAGASLGAGGGVGVGGTAAEAQVLVVSDRGRVQRIPVGDVLYLKAELKYVTLRTAEHQYVLDDSLADLEQRLGPAVLRVHRNALVARAAVRALERRTGDGGEGESEGEGWAVQVSPTNEWIAVSRRQLTQVRELLAKGGL